MIVISRIIRVIFDLIFGAFLLIVMFPGYIGYLIFGDNQDGFTYYH